MAGIQLIAEIEPKNSGSFALLDDKYLRGGLRVVETFDELSLIPADRLKDGCLAMVTTPSRVLYAYSSVDGNWSPFSSGGGGGGSDWLCVEDGETTKLVKNIEDWTQKIVVINHIRTYADYFSLPTEYIQNNEVAYCKADVMEGTTTYKKGLYSYDVTKASWVEVNSTIEIDSALSDTSKRPVQNRVVTKALEEKVSKDDIDNVISKHSSNPVENRVIATALEDIKNSKTMTAEEYDALDDETKNDGSFYYISDTGEIYQNGIIYGGKQVFDVTQEEYDALTDEEKVINEYHCTDTGRIYINGILYGDKKSIELTFEEYKQLEADGLVEEDVDYVIVSNEKGILLSSEDVGYKDNTVYEALVTLEEDVENLIDDETASTTSTYSSAKIDTELNKKLHTYSKQWYGSHDRYVKLGSIPISTGSVSVGSLLVTLFASSTKLEEYPVGTINLNISSGAAVNAFNINGFSTIALNTPRTDNIYTPRIVVDKTSTHYVLYIDCSYNYLKATCLIFNSTNFTFGDFETASALEGTEVWSSVTSDDIKYLGDIANVPIKEITFTNSTNWSNSSGNLKTFYEVRNGWCFLHVVAHCNKVANDANSVVYNNLPKPPYQVYGKFVGDDNSYEPCNLTIATNGQMLLRGGTIGKDYSFTYTYPIA